MENDDPIFKLRDKINDISPTFCAAKWLQVTFHLHTGHTHSCHHPVPHKVPLEEILENPTALHNTKFKKLQRKLMLEGERPAECDYCWTVEDSAPDAISDRIYKSGDSWALKHIDTVAKRKWDEDVIPTYVEVSFSSVCNFKCSYCGPQVSSKWMEEIEKKGPYPTSTNFGNIEYLKATDAMPIPHNKTNPYVDAFWKWWPELYPKLEQFRITGGEPLMTKDLFKVLDYIIEHPNPELHLSINTNMSPPESLFVKFIDKLKLIIDGKKVKHVKIFTSCEATGAQAEYIRFGLDYNKWWENIERVLDEVPGVTFTIMSTYNALSVFSFEDFLGDVLKRKRKYGKYASLHCPIMIDTPYLRWPPHQSMFILPRSYLPRIKDQVTFMYSHLVTNDWQDAKMNGYFKYEADKFRRIYDLMRTKKDSIIVSTDQMDFVKFVDEHDKRRGTNFLQTFPEMTNLYDTWKNEIK